MGKLVKRVTRALGLGGDANEVVAEMKRQAEAQAAQLRAQAERQAQQLRESSAAYQRQQEQITRQIAAQQQARMLEEQARRNTEMVETGYSEQANIEEELRRRNPRAQYMAPTGAYTGVNLHL